MLHGRITAFPPKSVGKDRRQEPNASFPVLDTFEDVIHYNGCSVVCIVVPIPVTASLTCAPNLQDPLLVGLYHGGQRYDSLVQLSHLSSSLSL